MKLGVDCWRIDHTTGVGRYVRNVIDAWSSRFSSAVFDQVTLYTPRPIESASWTIGPPLETRVLPSSAPQIVWQNTKLAYRCDSDVLWCPAYVTPVLGDATIVVTTHDATNAIRPELYPLADRLFYRRYYAWRARAATLVITNNEHTRADVARYYKVDWNRIRIGPLAPDKVFRRLEDRGRVAERVSELLGDDRPFFLSVGKISVRRNVPKVVEGFARFRKRTGLPHRMVVVGRGPALEEVRAITSQLDIRDHVTHLDFVADEDLVILYNGAEAFVTAATYESNSLTTLEAQTCGAPVVIPDVPAMRENTGDIAVVMSRVSVEEVAEAMKLVALDNQERERLSSQGRVYASGFSWARTAEKILEAAEEAVSIDRG